MSKIIMSPFTTHTPFFLHQSDVEKDRFIAVKEFCIKLYGNWYQPVIVIACKNAINEVFCEKGQKENQKTTEE